jgi:hypothetical protein
VNDPINTVDPSGRIQLNLNINWKPFVRVLWDGFWGGVGASVGTLVTSVTVVGIPVGAVAGGMIGMGFGELLWQILIEPNWDEIVSATKCYARQLIQAPRHWQKVPKVPPPDLIRHLLM